MFYEMRTYTLRPGSVPEVERRFGEALPERLTYSPLAAFWHTEIGPLNQIVHVWPYESLDERARIRKASVAAGQWPPPIREFIVDMRAELMVPFPDSPQLEPGNVGPYFELRSYVLQPGTLPDMIRAWNEKIAERTRLSPLLCSWYSDFGPLNRHVHIWAYNSLDQRAEIRARAVESGAWPPASRPYLQSQENAILVPAGFSPVQ